MAPSGRRRVQQEQVLQSCREEQPGGTLGTAPQQAAGQGQEGHSGHDSGVGTSPTHTVWAHPVGAQVRVVGLIPSSGACRRQLINVFRSH